MPCALPIRSEEHTSELQSPCNLVCRVLFRSDRKSTRLNSSHLVISYAVFCLKKETENSRWTCRVVQLGEIFVGCGEIPTQPGVERQICSYAIGVLEEQTLALFQFIEVVPSNLLHVIIGLRDERIPSPTSRYAAYPPHEDRIQLFGLSLLAGTCARKSTARANGESTLGRVSV